MANTNMKQTKHIKLNSQRVNILEPLSRLIIAAAIIISSLLLSACSNLDNLTSAIKSNDNIAWDKSFKKILASGKENDILLAVERTFAADYTYGINEVDRLALNLDEKFIQLVTSNHKKKRVDYAHYELIIDKKGNLLVDTDTARKYGRDFLLMAATCALRADLHNRAEMPLFAYAQHIEIASTIISQLKTAGFETGDLEHYLNFVKGCISDIEQSNLLAGAANQNNADDERVKRQISEAEKPMTDFANKYAGMDLVRINGMIVSKLDDLKGGVYEVRIGSDVAILHMLEKRYTSRGQFSTIAYKAPSHTMKNDDGFDVTFDVYVEVPESEINDIAKAKEKIAATRDADISVGRIVAKQSNKKAMYSSSADVMRQSILMLHQIFLSSQDPKTNLLANSYCSVANCRGTLRISTKAIERISGRNEAFEDQGLADGLMALLGNEFSNFKSLYAGDLHKHTRDNEDVATFGTAGAYVSVHPDGTITALYLDGTTFVIRTSSLIHYYLPYLQDVKYIWHNFEDNHEPKNINIYFVPDIVVK